MSICSSWEAHCQLQCGSLMLNILTITLAKEIRRSFSSMGIVCNPLVLRHYSVFPESIFQRWMGSIATTGESKESWGKRDKDFQIVPGPKKSLGSLFRMALLPVCQAAHTVCMEWISLGARGRRAYAVTMSLIFATFRGTVQNICCTSYSPPAATGQVRLKSFWQQQ